MLVLESSDRKEAPTVKNPAGASVLVPRFNMMVLAATIEPMRVANYLAPETLFEWEYRAPKGGEIVASNGMSVSAAPIGAAGGPFDVVAAKYGMGIKSLGSFITKYGMGIKSLGSLITLYKYYIIPRRTIFISLIFMNVFPPWGMGHSQWCCNTGATRETGEASFTLCPP